METTTTEAVKQKGGHRDNDHPDTGGTHPGTGGTIKDNLQNQESMGNPSWTWRNHPGTGGTHPDTGGKHQYTSSKKTNTQALGEL